ncbi:MAG: sugar transferase, partial [Phycisphaerales bacterium]
RILAAMPDPEAAYRDEILPRKLELAERYVRERSFAGDLAILVRTALAIFRRSSPPDTLVDPGESR